MRRIAYSILECRIAYSILECVPSKNPFFSVIHLFWHNFWILQFSHWIECKQGLYIDYLLIKLICCMFLTIYKLESCVLAWLGSKLLTFLWKCGLFFLQTAFSGYCSMGGGDTDSVMSFESCRALKLSKSESFRALIFSQHFFCTLGPKKLSNIESFRFLKILKYES